MSEPTTIDPLGVRMGWLSSALHEVATAQAEVCRQLKDLRGEERRQGIRLALETMGAAELAKGLGTSPAHIKRLARFRSRLESDER